MVKTYLADRGDESAVVPTPFPVKSRHRPAPLFLLLRDLRHHRLGEQRTPATNTAFSGAIRTTFTGSRMPASFAAARAPSRHPGLCVGAEVRPAAHGSDSGNPPPPASPACADSVRRRA